MLNKPRPLVGAFYFGRCDNRPWARRHSFGNHQTQATLLPKPEFASQTMKYLITALILLFAATAAQADTRLMYDGGDGEYIVAIRPGAIRIDTAGSVWQLYLKQSDTLFMVRPKRQSYTRMDENLAHAMQQQMARLRDKINAQIDKLPPNKRKAARAALAEQMPGFADASPKTTLKQLDTSDHIAGIACHDVQIMRGGQPAGRMCVADAKALGLSDAGHETLMAMFGLMNTMLANTGFESMGLPYNQLDGLPLRIRGAGGNERTLSHISHETLADSLFTIPDGFSEQTPPGTVQ